MKVKTYRPKIGKYNSLLSIVTRTPETTADWRKNFASTKVENEIANHEEWAREVLKAAGLPDSLRRVAVCKKNGKWRELPKGRGLKKGEKACVVTELMKDKPLTQGWYAADVLCCAEEVRFALANNMARDAASFAMRMVHKRSGACFQKTFELDVLKKRSSDSGAYSGGVARRWHVEPLRELIRDILRNNSGIKADAVWMKLSGRRSGCIDGVNSERPRLQIHSTDPQTMHTIEIGMAALRGHIRYVKSNM